jgi:hypothetical protein
MSQIIEQTGEMSERTTLTLTAREKSARPPAGHLGLTARSIQLTLVIDPAALIDFVVPNGKRPRFHIRVGERRLAGDLNPKTLRKVIATVAGHGPGNVAVLITGKLGAKDSHGADIVEEAGIAAQPRTSSA